MRLVLFILHFLVLLDYLHASGEQCSVPYVPKDLISKRQEDNMIKKVVDILWKLYRKPCASKFCVSTSSEIGIVIDYRNALHCVIEPKSVSDIKAFIRTVYMCYRSQRSLAEREDAISRLKRASQDTPYESLVDLLDKMERVLRTLYRSQLFEKAITAGSANPKYWDFLPGAEKVQLMRVDRDLRRLCKIFGNQLFRLLGLCRKNFFKNYTPEMIIQCISIAVNNGKFHSFTDLEFTGAVSMSVTNIEFSAYCVRAFFRMYLPHVLAIIKDPEHLDSKAKYIQLECILGVHTAEFLEKVGKTSKRYSGCFHRSVHN